MLKRYRMGCYVAGAASARAGDEMSGPALLLAGLAVTGSETAASTLLAGLMVAAAVGGPVFGALLDRVERPGRLLAWALAVYAGALLLILGTLGRLPLAAVAAIAVGAGLLGPALAGGWTSQLPRVVGPERLPRANALDAMTFNAAALAGPALAGAVAALAGAPAGMVVAAALILAALPVAWTLPATRTPRSRTPGGRSFGRDLAAGVGAIVRVRALAAATAVSVVSCVGQGVLLACAPLLGARVFGSADRGALLLSGVAAAALAANAVLARRPGPLRPDTVVWGSALVLAVALLLAATERPVLVAVAALVAGVGEGPQLTALFAVRHREAPERLRGQVFTTGASLKITGYAVGAGAAGPLAAWSLPGALAVAAAVQVAAASCALVGAGPRQERVAPANSRR
ncbi:MFS transporter [Actinomadura kijaniata]|uniref:MFS transporter n=1 Tax=Actinomadura kijaniata TaxID=46161 RepID=UPI0009FF2089|nr:MFS transporter [Actinomadura kijaniata]